MDMNVKENETNRKAVWFANKLAAFFGDRVSNIVIEQVEHVDGCSIFQKFVVTFIAYNYYPICCNYQTGNLVCFINYAKHGVKIINSQEDWTSMNFDLFLEELKTGIEFRIPRKYLSAKGWI